MATHANPAKVIVQNIPFDDLGAQFIPSPNSVWADYVINNRYEEDKHTYMMGVTSPTGFQQGSSNNTTNATVSFVQLASPTLLWIADWTVARFNEKPKIPNYDIGGGWVLLDKHIEPGMLTVSADGATVLYRISGTYFFGHKNPSSKIQNDINFSRPPWLDDFVDRTVPDTMFEFNLIDIARAFKAR